MNNPYMQDPLFAVIDTEKDPKKPRKKSYHIRLKLGKVCIGSNRSYQCRAIPYSPNFINRKHWAVKAAWKKAWEEEIWGRWQEEKGNHKETKFPLEDKAVLVIYIFCVKKQDIDNAYASLKGVIDGLVKCGILANDDYNHLTMTIEFVPVKTLDAEHLELSIKKYLRK
jgi:hypothetical protein